MARRATSFTDSPCQKIKKPVTNKPFACSESDVQCTMTVDAVPRIGSEDVRFVAHMGAGRGNAQPVLIGDRSRSPRGKLGLHLGASGLIPAAL